MPYQAAARRVKNHQTPINKHQNKFDKGYISTFANSRRPEDSLSDMTNMELVQDNIVRPRPPLARYGTQVPSGRGTTSVVTTNRITNPSIEVSTANWTTGGAGGSAIARVTTQFYVGVASLKFTTSNTSGNQQATTTITGLTIGQPYTTQVKVKTTVGSRVYFQSGFSGYSDYTEITATGGWDTITKTSTATATSGTVEFGTFLNGDLYIDAVQTESGSVANTYFDGSYTNTTTTDYAWTGTVHASTSTQTVYVYAPYTIIGRGSYRYSGSRGQLFMLNVAGVGKIYRQVDGGAFTLIGGVNAYSSTLWAGFRQSKSRVYVFNGDTTGAGNNATYIDLATMNTVEYVALSTPAAPTGVGSANLISGTKPYNYYVKVTANNAVGESAASTASTAINVNDIRDNWSSVAAIAKTVTYTATSVTNATSYTFYLSDNNTDFYELVTIPNPTGASTIVYTDDGSITLSPFKTAPAGNSTNGPVFTWMYVDIPSNQIYGITSDNKLYYSAPGTTGAADFSSLNGGGFLPIDDGGDTQLIFADGFRTGKGDPVVSVSSRGAAGKGKFNHVTFDQMTYGDQVFFVPHVTEANGQASTYAPRATIKARDSLYYPTGDSFKSTGTSQNIVNILTTATLSELIVDDVNRITLGSLGGAVGVEYQDKLYFCLPVGSTSNNEIWIMDLARKNAWTLRWPIAAKDIWLYEDNAGKAHLCVLVGNVIMEFSRAGTTPHTDDGVAWRSRVAFSSLVWDEDGISLGNIHNQYFKFLQPTGAVTVNTYGLSKRGSSTNTGTSSYTVDVSFTGIGQWDYSGNYLYGDNVGAVTSFAQSVAVLRLRPKGLLNQSDWEVIGETAGTDYFLSSVSTRGTANIDLVYSGLTR